MKEHERRSEIGTVLRRLSEDSNTFVRHGRLSAPARPAAWRGHLAPQIHTVAREATATWAKMDCWVQAQPAVGDVEAGMAPIGLDGAAAVMARFASVDLGHGVELMDPHRALDLAARVIDLLGPDALWWTNHDADCHSWTAMTGCTFDGVVAGTDGTLFAVLLQAVED
ncbi:hypothetical protein [Streptomyces sp. NPDC006552]|uniref:hypothetical protein n=1 Tax=Streptomyces sp. NPDC006552 TaxID=3157179 RepID=UPI0033B9EE2F